MTKTILIVGECENDQIAYRQVLREVGYTVAAVKTSAAGLAAAQLRPAAILLDDYPPDDDPLGFIRRASEDGPKAPPIVVLTVSGNEGMVIQALRAGAYDYLIKDEDGGYLTLLPAVVERAMREWQDRIAKIASGHQLQLAMNVYNHIAEGIVVTDAEGTIVSVNPAFCFITGYGADELVGANPRLIKSNRHGPDYYRGMWDSIIRDRCWQGEIWNRRKNGNLFLARQMITAICHDDGRVEHYVGVLRDLTETKQVEEFISDLAYHDPLTNLPNRSLFMDRLRQEIARATRPESVLALLYIDLDHLAEINEALGHAVGDDLIKAAAARLKGCVRESDTVARLGGDSFTVILNDHGGREDVGRMAQKMLDEIIQPVPIGKHELRISASIGIALYPEHGDGAAALLKTADDALYEAKCGGRGIYFFSTVG